MPSDAHLTDNDRLHVLALLMILALSHFDVENRRITRTLDCYGLNTATDINTVEQYLKDKKILEHLEERWHPCSGQIVRTMRGTGLTSTDATLTITYRDDLPVRMEIKSHWLPRVAFEDRVVVHTYDCRQIIISVTEGRILCRLWGQNDATKGYLEVQRAGVIRHEPVS